MIDYFEGVILTMGLDLEFGKYQGCMVSEIVESDPDYIAWLVDQGVDCDEEVYSFYEQMDS